MLISMWVYICFWSDRGGFVHLINSIYHTLYTHFACTSIKPLQPYACSLRKQPSVLKLRLTFLQMCKQFITKTTNQLKAANRVGNIQQQLWLFTAAIGFSERKERNSSLCAVSSESRDLPPPPSPLPLAALHCVCQRVEQVTPPHASSSPPSPSPSPSSSSKAAAAIWITIHLRLHCPAVGSGRGGGGTVCTAERQRNPSKTGETPRPPRTQTHMKT